MFHASDAYTLFPAGWYAPGSHIPLQPTPYKTLKLGTFWTAFAVPNVQTSDHHSFGDMRTAVGSQFCPLPSWWHSINVLEFQHVIISSAVLCVTHAKNKFISPLAAEKLIRISDDLYGSDFLSAFEITEALHPIVHSDAVTALSGNFFEAWGILEAWFKLAIVLRSKSISLPTIAHDIFS